MINRIKSSTHPITLAMTAMLATACSQGVGLPPVSDTAPSQDAAIIDDNGLMSDGSPVTPHLTQTVPTSIELASQGQVGGTSVDREGNIYNANFRNLVWRTTPSGETIILSDEFQAASGNFALDDGQLLQSDYDEAKIYRIHPDGSREIWAEGGMVGPVGIARRASGEYLVADYKGQFVAAVPASGGVATPVLRDDRLQGPNGLTIDNEGNVYIADLKSNIVFKWTPEGKLIELAVLPGRGNAHNVFANGALYVNKIWDHAIYRVEIDTGVFGLVSGNGVAGYEDGITGVATIEEPNGIATNATRDVVYFNTHRGTMARQAPGFIVLRTLTVDSQEPNSP